MSMGPAPPAAPGSYSQIASRGSTSEGKGYASYPRDSAINGGEDFRPCGKGETGVQCASMEEESPGWGPSAEGGRETRGWASQKNVDALEFAYVEGIPRIRYSEARSLLRVAGVYTRVFVDTRSTGDISFVGGSVCPLLSEKALQGRAC